jgi:cob(I)alamin adenosyltransferase
VSKTNSRIVAYGTIDELNSHLGVVLATENNHELSEILTRIQNDLFDLGADLCVPESDEPPTRTPLRVTAEQVTQLEHWIDAANDRLQPLTSFILPGGSLVSAQLHIARTVCRRSEIDVLRLAAVERINPQVVIYLNRLSDLLFVLARRANGNGKQDVLWVPGANRK